MQGLSLSVTALCGKLIAHVDIDPITFPLGHLEEGQAVCCPHVAVNESLQKSTMTTTVSDKIP